MKILFKDIPIHVDTYGDGKSLILLHGFLESSQIWDKFIPLLKKQYQIICIDLFGHGKTPKFNEVHEMETMAEAVSTVMEYLKIESASLIGHSMGGYVIMAFLEKFPEKADRIMLLNSTPMADSEERKKERDENIKIVTTNKDVFVQMAITRLFAEGNRRKFKNEIQQHIAEAKKIPAENIVATLKGMKIRKDRTAILRKFSKQKLIVAGKKDPLIPPEAIQKVAADTQAKLVSFPCGHMSYIEEEEDIKAVLKTFIQN